MTVTPAPSAAAAAALQAVGARVVERGWLSSNGVLFHGDGAEPPAIVDTGYVAHADQTLALVRAAAGAGSRLKVVNTHLHSDHCGGNAMLQAHFDADVWIPAVSLEAVRAWDESRLTFAATEQRCERFEASGGMAAGETVTLGARRWQVLAAPGHDPLALMFFEPEHRVLIAGDALWERSLAIVFPELAGEAGFDAAEETLARIERLRPSVVVPGHGPAFGEVVGALAASRARLEAFRRDPRRHAEYAARALLVFRLLELRCERRDAVLDWVRRAPVLARAEVDAAATLDRLVRDGVVRDDGNRVAILER